MKTLLLALAITFGSLSIAQEYQDDCMDNLLIPESFSPNGDAIDDVYKLDFPCPPETIKIGIFNSAGEEVYTSEKADFQWDGTQDGKHLPAGGYYLILDFTFNGGIFNKKARFKLVK